MQTQQPLPPYLRMAAPCGSLNCLRSHGAPDECLPVLPSSQPLPLPSCALQIHTNKMSENSFLGRDVDIYELAGMQTPFFSMTQASVLLFVLWAADTQLWSAPCDMTCSIDELDDF